MGLKQKILIVKNMQVYAEHLEISSQVQLYKQLLEMNADPYLNHELVHPDTPTFKRRILDHPILQAHYRPDLYPKSWNDRPSSEQVLAAVDECIKGLDTNVLMRTARTCGVYFMIDTPLLKDRLCTALFSHLTKADVPRPPR